jgi:hypothetical protein
MTIDLETFARIASPLITLLIAGIVKHYSERRSKVVSFLGHVSSFTLQDERRSQVYTHSIVVRNTGRKSATNVRIGHNVLPPNIQVFPPVKYTVEQNPEGAAEIIIPILVPREQVTVSYLYFPPLTWDRINAYTKSDDGFAKILNVIPVPQPSRLLLSVFWILVFLGATSVIYWLVKLLPYVLQA